MKRNSLPSSPIADGTLQGADLQRLRQSNRLLILNGVREHDGILSRAALAHSTGLSRTTVGIIVDALIADGYVVEGNVQRAEASHGRRVIPLHFNAKAGTVLGVGMGRSHLTLLACDLAANVIAHHEMSLSTVEGPVVCMPQVIAAIQKFVTSLNDDWSRIIGIGLGMPGPLDAAQASPLEPPRMPGWNGYPVRYELATALHVPIYLDNNAKMGALGELRYGAGRDVQNMLYVKIGRGIGSGIIIDNRVYRGASGSAGEIGHMSVDPHGPACDCGKLGCLETLAGSQAIIEAAQRLLPNIIGLDDVIRAAHAGNGDARAIFTQVGTYVGIAISNLINFLNPALLVLDGSVMQAGDLMMHAIDATVERQTLAAPRAQTRIVLGALAGRATALGGVATVLDTHFSLASMLGNNWS